MRRREAMDYLKLYRTNEEFKQYVDKCAKANKESAEETITKCTVREVGKYYATKEEERRHSQTIITAGCGGAT